jgi:hypothetical protein
LHEVRRDGDVGGDLVRVVDGIPCVQLAELEAAARDPRRAPGQVVTLGCVHCSCRVLLVDYLPDRKVVAFRCASCGDPAMNPIIPEDGANVAGSESPAGGPPSGIVLS